LGDGFGGKMPGFAEGLAQQQLGQNRTGRYGTDTTFSSEAGLNNVTILDTNRQAQDIATDGVAYVSGATRIFELAGVARILEVIQNDNCVHENEYIAA